MPSVYLAEVVILCLQLTSDVFDPQVGGQARKNLCVNDTDALRLDGFLKPVSHISDIFEFCPPHM